MITAVIRRLLPSKGEKISSIIQKLKAKKTLEDSHRTEFSNVAYRLS